MKRYLLAVKYSCAIMLVCSLVFVLNILLPINLNQWGILPRATENLPGILFAPFLHASLAHLMSNFFPFIILGMLIAVQSVKRFWLLFIFFIITTGALVWLFARGNSVHIGMSGVIYALWGYLLVYGFVRRQIASLIISLITLFFYGGLVLGVLPSTPQVSFESHLFGAAIGAFTGYYLAKREVQYPLQ
jgi:membrane associated rhomboid family serine protease